MCAVREAPRFRADVTGDFTFPREQFLFSGTTDVPGLTIEIQQMATYT